MYKNIDIVNKIGEKKMKLAVILIRRVVFLLSSIWIWIWTTRVGQFVLQIEKIAKRDKLLVTLK